MKGSQSFEGGRTCFQVLLQAQQCSGAGVYRAEEEWFDGGKRKAGPGHVSIWSLTFILTIIRQVNDFRQEKTFLS